LSHGDDRAFRIVSAFVVADCDDKTKGQSETDRIRAGAAFVIAYTSHLAADNYVALAAGRIPSDLFWPLTLPVPRPAIPYWAGPESINIHLFTLFSVGVLSITAYYGVVDLVRHARASR
jgi:hypothetical protein